MQRVNMALARGAAASASRRVDLTDPASWEFSGFSQNGEDGIIDVLTRQLKKPNRYFIEIGASDGLENNTSWLAMVRRYSGLFIEGDSTSSYWCKYVFTPLNYGVESIGTFVTRDNVPGLKAAALHTNPDVLSIDVDGNDYHLIEAILSGGFKPKICVVEYNSAFGPEHKITIPYDENFRVVQRHKDSLYYGCSLGAWRAAFAKHGYQFVTVDANGVNAFFADPAEFEAEFIRRVRGREFAENYSHAREYKSGWREQYDLIRDRKFVEINP